MKTTSQFLIFTDMDGTLLDHFSYSFEPAKDTLVTLEKNDIPVIPVSSKTKAELVHIRHELNNQHPFIIENGAAVYIPIDYFNTQPEDTVEEDGFWVKAFVDSRAAWQTKIASLSERFGHSFKTFEQIGVEGIIETTQLDYDAAVRASQRQYGEPVAWYGTEHQKHLFIDALTQQGAHILHGGRFMHVSGECNKGNALAWLAAQYQSERGLTVSTIAAGDSQNDEAMLNVADYAVIVKSPVHAAPQLHRTTPAYLTNETGPAGWVEGITNVISHNNKQ
jgi:mannosyl-3-phosphoglycerate phosphatase family protein